MKGKLLLLIGLQECDSQLVMLLSKKKHLPEQMDRLDQDFLRFKEGIEQNKKKYDEMKSLHNAKEKEVKKINENITKARERLLEVKNNKEYQAILKEIEMAEASCGDIETEIISLLEELDKVSVLVKKDEETLNQQKKKYGEEKNRIETEINTIDSDFVNWEQKRDELRKKVPGDLLAQYEKIKNRNNGVGVISVWKAVCNGCHMNIPPQLYNELQKSVELLSCPNCNRIIYFENREKPA
ncbi:MAG: C4-type zinc ribbon domain-containing protein [Smithellaceae bacterium]